MTTTTITFTTKPLEECIGLTREMDRLCFPTEMWMGQDELLRADAEATILHRNGEPIGQVITLAETRALDLLLEADPSFEPSQRGMYSYSEAIAPQYQRQGYGTMLLIEVCWQLRQLGYSRLTAHVRTRHDWHKGREEKLGVCSVRYLNNFWEDPRDAKVAFQLAHL